MFEFDDIEAEIVVSKTELKVADLIPNPFQPRKKFDEVKLNELADSINDNGLLQEIVVCVRDGKHIIVAGERRWRAHKILGLDTIRANIIEADDKQLMKIALLENEDREDLSSIEKAESVLQLWQKGGFKSKTELAEFLKKPLSYVSKNLGVFNLSDAILEKFVGRKDAGIDFLYDLSRVGNEKVQIELVDAGATREEIREHIPPKQEKQKLRTAEFREEDIDDIIKTIKEFGACRIVVSEIVEVKEQNGGTSIE